jgi:non-ribosomal peptide synthetase component E (peptide arylation enzyme)
LLLIVADDETDSQEILAGITMEIGNAIAAGSLPKWCMPDDIRFVDEIAKTSVGKIDKKALRMGVIYPAESPDTL